MFRLAVAIIVLLFALATLAGGAAERHDRGIYGKGKMSAPVAIEAQLGESAGEVSVSFAAAATGVEISVKGVDGLVVSSSPLPVSGGAFAKGEKKSFHVTYTAGPGRSHLVIALTGRFAGAKRMSVASFAVGERSAEQKKSVGKVQTDSRGKRMKLFKSGER